MPTLTDVEDIARGYAHAATWADLQIESRPDEFGSESYLYGLDEIDEEGQRIIRQQCFDFALHNSEDVDTYLAEIDVPHDSTAGEMCGHDLYLTSVGHGAGFWDRGLGELGERLTAAAKAYGVNGVWLDESGDDVIVRVNP
jgi:hypothetical protein